MADWTKEQLLAIDKENTNIIVSAGAGSGKTSVLSERVIRKLKSGTKINELLILTFTKKAAYEMKDRIRSAIEATPSLKDNLSLIDSAYITTFDSFSLSIVKKYNYILNISKNINIIDSSIIYLYKRKVLDDIFKRLYDEHNHLFEKLITTFTLKDDKDIKDYILNISNKMDLIYDKDKYLNSYIDDYYNEKNISYLIDSYIKIINSKVRYIDNLLTEISNYVDIKYYDDLYNSVSYLLSANTYKEYKEHINIELPRLPSKSMEEAKELKSEIKDCIDEIDALLVYDDEDELKNTLLSTEDYVSIIIDIIKELDSKIYEYKYDKEYFEFIDISKLAIKIVLENNNIRDEMKKSFKEIMIDEYQDTSDLQDLFISQIENNNVYMVGDIKQSIYRFRNANPYLFKEKYDNYSKNNGGFKIDLTSNFRSRDEVVKAVNLVFENIMTDNYGGAAYKDSHQMIFGNKSYEEEGKTSQNYNLEILNYVYDKECNYSKKEIEIFTIARDIKNKIDNKYQIFDKKKKILRDATYDDFVILIADKSNFDLFKKIFEYLEIPLTKYSDTNLLEDSLIYIVKNIINLLISYKNTYYDTNFKYSLVSVLRSYLFSYDDEKIFKMFKDNNFLDNPAIDIVEAICADIDALSLVEILNLIIEKFDFYSKIVLIGDVDKNINRLDEIEDIFRNISNIGYDLYSAYDYLEELIESGSSVEVKEIDDYAGSVKIMTIHASKGLEFPICYFPFLNVKFNITELNERFLFDKKYGIITPYYKEGIGTMFTKKLYKEFYLKEEVSEKIRLLYVALTRPKEKIIMITELDKSKRNISNVRTFLDMLSIIRDYLAPYIKEIDIDKLNISKDYNLIKDTNYKKAINKTNNNIVINDYSLNSEEENSKKASKTIKGLISSEEKNNMEYGTYIHKILEYIDFQNPNYDGIDDNVVIKIKKLISILKLDDVINIFKEYEFSYKDNKIINRGVIDLLLEYKDRFEIIDYKLSDTEDEAYKNQLLEYQKYIESKTNKVIHTYLYSINKGELIEIK